MLFYAFTSNFTYAVAGSLLRQWLAQGTRLVWFNRVLAAVLGAGATMGAAVLATADVVVKIGRAHV